ncbi:uncharacterized protein E5676_scaffold455G007250 [Cucumis melo var. makuwa]|uniref:Uncharacterized protein n=1 Tax=Cucumis melo var. makuwa TaxID=1194695 RepID=A0A5A7TBN7_CUCMM|nr:uncharacterized protein E6C27_scaffold92G003500 [Cucumis melo var. makuwa]TYK31416.1 uncharacterized protein E5676_scaffold455G007250 [Cucumis melo var. makuwa]
MALTINCSSSSVFLLPQPPHLNSFDSTKTAKLPLKEDGGSWRSRSVCALGLASLIFAIEIGDVFIASESLALESSPQLVDYYSRRRMKKIPRWSDEIRKCAPWRAKSLEIIVPENLPRPSQRRKCEAIAYEFIDMKKNAPGVQVISSEISSDYCFSL